MSITAYDFQRDFLELQPDRSIYRELTQDLSYYFNSHLHNTEVSHLEFPIIVDHLQEFLSWFASSYNGDQVSMAYAEYYKELAKTNPDIQKFIWNVLYSISIYYPDSNELQAIGTAIVAGKGLCKFLVDIRRVFADINSLKPREVYMDILETQPKNLHLYFSAIFGKRSVLKMPLLQGLGQSKHVMGSDLAKVLVADWLNGQSYSAKHHAKAQELSLNNLPFAKMSHAKEVKAAEKNIDKMHVKDLDYRKTMSTASKPKSEGKNSVTVGDMSRAKVDLTRQVNYIRSETSSIEVAITNGTACMRNLVDHYNEMHEWHDNFDDDFFNLLHKIKTSKAANKFDIGDKDVQKYKDFQRAVTKKKLFNEMGGIKEDCGFDGIGVSSYKIRENALA
jgi:hypothetical protein